MKRVAGSAVGLLLLLCLVLGMALSSVQGCSHLLHVHEMGSGDENDYTPPEGATCDNAGVLYPDNPVHGWPVPGTGWGNITAYFCDPTYYDMFGHNHWGIDISVANGAETMATAYGTVTRAGHDGTYGMGNNVKFCTDDGWCVIYMHLQDIAVHVGENVTPGQVIGWTDNTGNSTGPHLHYQINDPQGIPIDPAPTM